ncbi:MAG: phBC6A51 family helix-turn-helix protein [Candidatus Shapirobacteria bacterium]|nr:phBC6A51 family helix-turn-helix protein [Candidatus Shapirobacteria bacterium]
MKSNKDKQLLVEQLKTTPIIQVACQKIGVSRASYYRWRQQNKSFQAKVDQAIKEGVSLVNDLAESQLISAIKDGNMTALIFWLKNRNPNYDTTKLQISPGVVDKDEPLTPDQQQLVKKALEMATILPSQSEDKNETTKQSK